MLRSLPVKAWAGHQTTPPQLFHELGGGGGGKEETSPNHTPLKLVTLHKVAGTEG